MWYILIPVCVGIVICVVIFIRAFLEAVPDVPEGFQLPPLGKILIPMKTKNKKSKKNAEVSSKKKESRFPMTREEFMSKAPAALTFADAGTGLVIPAVRKMFSTKALGWGYQGPVTIVVDGKPLNCYVGLNITASGSKPDLDEEEEENEDEE